MYNIVVYELIIFYEYQNYKNEHINFYKDNDNFNVGIGTNKRQIKHKYFRKVFSIDNVSNDRISSEIIALKQRYKDSKYLIEFEKDINKSYIQKMNKKSEKKYYDYISNRL